MGDYDTPTSTRPDRPDRRRSVAGQVVIGVFAAGLCALTLFGVFVSMVAIALHTWDDGAPPGSRAPDYWFSSLPWFVSPAAVVVTLILLVRYRRYRILVLAAGYAVVLTDHLVFLMLLKSAPTWVYP